jgi:hypothetical protein
VKRHDRRPNPHRDEFGVSAVLTTDELGGMSRLGSCIANPCRIEAAPERLPDTILDRLDARIRPGRHVDIAQPESVCPPGGVVERQTRVRDLYAAARRVGTAGAHQHGLGQLPVGAIAVGVDEIHVRRVGRARIDIGSSRHRVVTVISSAAPVELHTRGVDISVHIGISVVDDTVTILIDTVAYLFGTGKDVGIRVVTVATDLAQAISIVIDRQRIADVDHDARLIDVARTVGHRQGNLVLSVDGRFVRCHSRTVGLRCVSAYDGCRPGHWPRRPLNSKPSDLVFGIRYLACQIHRGPQVEDVPARRACDYRCRGLIDSRIGVPVSVGARIFIGVRIFVGVRASIGCILTADVDIVIESILVDHRVICRIRGLDVFAGGVRVEPTGVRLTVAVIAGSRISTTTANYQCCDQQERARDIHASMKIP